MMVPQIHSAKFTKFPHIIKLPSHTCIRAGANGTAIAIPDFEGEKKWRHLDSNLGVCYGIASHSSSS